MPTRVGTAVGKRRLPSNQQTLQDKRDGHKARGLEKSGKHAISQLAFGICRPVTCEWQSRSSVATTQ